MNKSLITNICAVIAIIVGYYIQEELGKELGKHLFEVGIFAAAGAITNWLAIHMLFEKVPLLYGSGVIPNRFEEFKTGIQNLIMNQFFTIANIEKFLDDPQGHIPIDYKGLISCIEMDNVFKGLTDVVLSSKLGGMLNMFGGASSLDVLKEPFNDKIRDILIDTIESDSFQDKISEAAHGGFKAKDFHPKIEAIVTQRLDELTPQLVKEIIQDIIKAHLGWLVVWGGVFGGIIGLITSFCR